VERPDAENLASNRDKEAALGEFTPQANVVRRKREYPSGMRYASRQVDICLLYYRGRQF